MLVVVNISSLNTFQFVKKAEEGFKTGQTPQQVVQQIQPSPPSPSPPVSSGGGGGGGGRSDIGQDQPRTVGVNPVTVEEIMKPKETVATGNNVITVNKNKPITTFQFFNEIEFGYKNVLPEINKQIPDVIQKAGASKEYVNYAVSSLFNLNKEKSEKDLENALQRSKWYMETQPIYDGGYTFDLLKANTPGLYIERNPDKTGYIPTFDVKRWYGESFENLGKQKGGFIAQSGLAVSTGLSTIFDPGYYLADDKKLFVAQKQYDTITQLKQGDVFGAWRDPQIPAYSTVILPLVGAEVFGAVSEFSGSYISEAFGTSASHVFTAGQIVAGTVMVAPTVKDIGETFLRGEIDKGLIKSAFFGTQMGLGYAGYKDMTTRTFTRGLTKGAEGYTLGQLGAFKGKIKYINQLEINMGKIESGLLRSKPGTWFEKTPYGMMEKGGKWAEVRYNVSKYEKLVGITEERATAWRDYTTKGFKIKSTFGKNIESLETTGGLIGQKDMGTDLFYNAESMKGRYTDIEYMNRQVVNDEGEIFGGTTYKTSLKRFNASHDSDIAYPKLTKAMFDIKAGIDDTGMDIKPLYKPGKVVTGARDVKQPPYLLEGKFGKVAVMKQSESMTRLLDASWMPTLRRGEMIDGKFVSKDIPSAGTLVARQFYRAKTSNNFSLRNLANKNEPLFNDFIKASYEWNKNPVTMTSAMEEAFFKPNMHQRWSEFWSDILVKPEKVLPEKLPFRNTISSSIKYVTKNLRGNAVKDIWNVNKSAIDKSVRFSDMPPMRSNIPSDYYFGSMPVSPSYSSPVSNFVSPSIKIKSSQSFSPSKSSYGYSFSNSKSNASKYIGSDISVYVNPSSPFSPSFSPSISPSISEYPSPSISPPSPSISKSPSPSPSKSSSIYPSSFFPSSSLYAGSGHGWEENWGKKKRYRESLMGNPLKTMQREMKKMQKEWKNLW